MKQKCFYTGKQIFKDYDEAFDRLIYLNNHHPKDPITTKRIKHRQLRPGLKRVYYCNYCMGYHLTSQIYYYVGDPEDKITKVKMDPELLKLWRALLPADYTSAQKPGKKRNSGYEPRRRWSKQYKPDDKSAKQVPGL